MKKASWIRAAGLACVVAVIAMGCGGGDNGVDAAREEQFAAVKEQKAALDAKRQEIADLEAQIAAAEEAADSEDATAEEGDAEAAASPSLEELQASLSTARGEAEDLAEELMNGIVAFLNSANMVEGEEPTGLNLEAIRMKSAEDMLIAQEYIVRGGDYRRAMDILDTALMLDPNNPELQAARASAEEMQYMTEERFAAVQKGMTEDQVRELLGTVHRNNLREYPDKNVVAWFYRRADSGAAGVYFEEKDGEYAVYRVDFNAVEAPEEEGAATE